MKNAYNACKDFEQVLKTQKVVLPNLDEWLTAFSKWTIDPVALADTKDEQDKILLQRQDLCNNSSVSKRVWSPATLKTVRLFASYVAMDLPITAMFCTLSHVMLATLA